MNFSAPAVCAFGALSVWFECRYILFFGVFWGDLDPKISRKCNYYPQIWGVRREEEKSGDAHHIPKKISKLWSIASSWDTTHNSSAHWGNLFPLVLICYRRVLVCLSAIRALLHRGQACSGDCRRCCCAPYTPIPVVPFMVQGPLISVGSCTYFMDTSLLQKKTRREGWIRVAGWSRTGGGWWWTVPLPPVHCRPSTLQQKVLDHLVQPLAALQLTQFEITWLFDWMKGKKAQCGIQAVQNVDDT